MIRGGQSGGLSQPTYRFWGHHNPQGRVKPAILAEIPPGSVGDDGVATIRLYDPIDSWGDFWGVSAREMIETLDGLTDVSQINLHINSPGGEVFEAIAILNALRQHPAEVTAIVDGVAASAASFIAAGADRLVMGKNTELMIHDAWGIAVGPAADMRDMADRLDQMSNNIASIYAEKSGASITDWRAAMLAETWYSAEDAVEAGLADEVAGADDGKAQHAAARWDTSVLGRRNKNSTGRPGPVRPGGGGSDGGPGSGRTSNEGAAIRTKEQQSDEDQLRIRRIL
jgi:ATP-dependent Clp endopeptidase proteolytic subunit ClpP